MFSRLKKIQKDRKKSARNMRDIQRIVDTSVKAERLQCLSVNSDKKLVTDEKKLNFDLIVSLTAYSRRIHEVHLTIESIGQQSVKPNRIILWLDEDEFTLNDLPQELLNQIERGLEVRFCPNYKSYKKIIPTLANAPDAGIITIDDDVLYSPNLIDILIKEHLRSPECIIGNRAHKIRYDASNNPLPYKQWEYDYLKGEASHHLLLTGMGGIFYPPGSLHEDVIKPEIFMDVCPHADDLWLKVMAFKKGTLCKKTDFSSPCLPLMSARDIGLAQINIKKGGNDKQFKKLLDYYQIKLNQ